VLLEIPVAHPEFVEGVGKMPSRFELPSFNARDGKTLVTSLLARLLVRRGQEIKPGGLRLVCQVRRNGGAHFGVEDPGLVPEAVRGLLIAFGGSAVGEEPQ